MRQLPALDRDAMRVVLRQLSDGELRGEAELMRLRIRDASRVLANIRREMSKRKARAA